MSELEAPTATLLLVDDEPAILSSLRRLLRPCGYRLLLAEGGQSGLAILEEEKVDLVISDMRMPEMDGAQFLEHVRQRWPDAVRLLLTGYSDITSTIDAINRGEIYRYIAKPWDDNDLKLIIKGALESSNLKKENERLLALTQQQNEALSALNMGLEDKVKQRTSEIEQVNSFLNLANDTLKKNFVLSIKVFARLIELRGGANGGHAQRVASLSKKLAAHLGLDSKTQQDVYYAGLLHDIGKIGFSDSLLQKPVVKMTSEETALYRKHVVTGEAALMPIEELREVAKITRFHHERVDGQGFPDRLMGIDIPIGAKILSIINDFDGLQSGILSEKHHTSEEALNLIRAGANKRYDPAFVEAFAELLEKIKLEVVPERSVGFMDLKVGMVLARDLVSKEGVLMLSADHVLDVVLIRKIQEFARRTNSALTIYIRTDSDKKLSS